jgi:hypothetical protein
MDRETAIDRITETENLTDGLEDDDANWLLDWGIAHVDGVITGITDEDAAGDKLNQLMAVMRSLNQIAADRAAKPPDALAADIRMFLERYQQAFGAPNAAAPAADTTSATTTDATTPGAVSMATPAARAGGPQTPASGKPSKAAPTPPSPPAQQTTKSTNTGPSAPTKKAGTTRQTPSTDTSSATPPDSATSPANATTQARSAPDRSVQAAGKIAAMSPRDAMQYLISLAEAPTSGA